MGKILQPGTKAPEFNAPVTPDQKLSLSDLKGRRVILASTRPTGVRFVGTR